MKLEKQLMILGLFQIGRYSVDPDTGELFSHNGNTKKIKGNILPNGYHQHPSLDIGFAQNMSVYAHQLVYLWKWRITYDPKYVIDHIDGDRLNNNWENLRVVTEKENIKGNNSTGFTGLMRNRLPESEKQQLYKDYLETGLSGAKLAEKYNIVRQTAHTIIKFYRENPDKLI